jgi:hypothetical protein
MCKAELLVEYITCCRDYVPMKGNYTYKPLFHIVCFNTSVVVKTLCYSRKIAGSGPDETMNFFSLPNPSGRTIS